MAMIQDAFSSFEVWLSQLLADLAAILSSLSTRLSTHPLSASIPEFTLPTPSEPFHYLITALLLLPPLPFLLPILLRPFLPDVSLQTVPPPSKVFEPYEDPQSDEFPDADAAPQLTNTGLRCIAPATGLLLGHVESTAATDVPALVARARSRQPSWAATSFAQRRKVLRVLRDYLLYNHVDVVNVVVDDTGKTRLDAYLGEIVPTLEKIRWLLQDGAAALAPSRRRVGPMTIHKAATVEYMPLGVIAAIAPWNYPVHNFLNPVLAALFAGNAVVVKPSEETVYSTLHVVRIIRRILKLCGHDPDLVQCLIGGPDVGEALVVANIDKLFFTGSTAVGCAVAKVAAPRLTPTCMELGGKDAFIVCDDAEIPHAANICLRGVFQNAGQNCIGVERVFVQDGVAAQFLQYVEPIVRDMRLGVDVGALTLGERAARKIEELIADAVAKGARLVVGGKRTTVDGKGSYFQPTILAGVSSNMRISHEEVFGPVLSLSQFSDDEELIKRVNECAFGLGSSIFSGSTRRADRILAGLRVGMGNVNDFATNYLCQSMPFGGTKMSGSDRFAGIEGLRGCCIPKAVTRDRFPGVKTRIPKALKYPVASNASELAAEINDMVYSKGWISKIDNTRNLIGMSLFPSWCPRSTGSG